jgi:sugar phosphate isomerase/epimerase
MKIGASTLATFNNSLDKSLAFIEGLGIKYAELLHQYPTENFDLDLLDSFDLEYTIHAPFMDVNIAALGSKSRAASMEQIKDSIDFANEINAEAVVVHPGLAPFLANKYFLDTVYKYSNESIEEIGKYSENQGVLTTIENMPTFD